MASLVQILQLIAEEYLNFVCNPEGSDIPTAVRSTPLTIFDLYTHLCHSYRLVARAIILQLCKTRRGKVRVVRKIKGSNSDQDNSFEMDYFSLEL